MINEFVQLMAMGKWNGIINLRKMPWRRDVAREMTIIDGECSKDRQIKSRRGAKEVVRLKNGAKGDTRRSAPKDVQVIL
jgi:hypothetical protein